MAERRSLIEGLKPEAPNPDHEEAFVYGEKKPPRPKVGKPAALEDQQTIVESEAAPVTSNKLARRVPFSTRVRHDLADRVLRASLERRLAKQQPSSMTEIVEEALAAWLTGHGYQA